MKRVTALLLLLISIALMAAFLLGADSFNRDFAFGLDAGVAAAAASLLCAAIGAVLFRRPGERLGTLSRAMVMSAGAWLPFSIMLAGGTQLSFSGWRSWVWLVFTGALLFAILATWIAALTVELRSRAAA